MIQDLVPVALHPYLALAALLLCFVGLSRRPQAADVVVLGSLVLLLVTGVRYRRTQSKTTGVQGVR